MSKIIALTSKRSLDFTILINNLVSVLQCEVIDTLKNSYILHHKMNTTVCIVDSKTGPHQSTFKAFRSLGNAKRCIDGIIKMVVLHSANTELIGDTWTDKCIPDLNAKYVLIVGIYTTKDIERIHSLGGKIVMINEENGVNYGSVTPVMSDELENLLLSSNPHIVSSSDNDIVNNIIKVFE